MGVEMTRNMPRAFKLHPMFEPERYPAADIRFGVASVAVFATGKINLKGPCGVDYMVDVLMRLLPVLCHYLVEDDRLNEMADTDSEDDDDDDHFYNEREEVLR